MQRGRFDSCLVSYGQGNSECNALFSPTILPYHIAVSEWTPKRSAILGVVFSGTSVLFLGALIVAMNWQQGRSPGQKDWGIVFAAALGVPFVCCSVAAALSFVVSASLIAHKRFFGLRQSPAALTAIPEPSRRKVRHPALITLAGLAVLIACSQLGTGALLFVGIPAMLVASAIAGGARPPTKIPLSDAVLYVGISVAIVIGIAVYVLYKH